MLRKLSGLFHEEGMENIQVIPKARIPIIKFKDPRSGLDVDISLDNRLAIHNSMMLKSYAQEERLQRLIQMVKYWASRRGINNAFRERSHPMLGLYSVFNTHSWSNHRLLQTGKRTLNRIHSPSKERPTMWATTMSSLQLKTTNPSLRC